MLLRVVYVEGGGQDYLVGRGNLKRIFILLKFKIKSRFNIRVEYHLEYRVAGFEPGTPDC